MQIHAPARATPSSLRTCRTLKTVVKRKFLSSPSDPFVTSDMSDAQVVKCKFWMWPSNPFVTSDVSEAQNCGKMEILRLRVATLSSLSCVSDAQNCGKMDILDIAERPFRHFVCGGR